MQSWTTSLMLTEMVWGNIKISPKRLQSSIKNQQLVIDRSFLILNTLTPPTYKFSSDSAENQKLGLYQICLVIKKGIITLMDISCKTQPYVID